MRPTPKCVLDRSRPCNACIAPGPSSCPYPYLLAGDDTMDPNNDVDTADDSAHAEK
ncbi:hypothetical protein GCM10010306_087760 [Streptomyces umbrinus]|uniref:hypothetical protein n=1 Tax=Streptomyces umbrinus TaxID=67370 RepID=UPI0016772852|nr:hypothetical protein [Streptomyces umbrinus]GHB80083.1 hypothetical protein GCM10010306_087760 [Streptomyces umbrinus]